MKKVNWEKMVVTFLRCAVGWHLLYGGVSKFLAGNWTATEYLSNAQGPFAGFYHWLGSSEGLMAIIDPLNMYGLILIGLGLFVGLAVSYAAVAAIVLLTFYYFAYPPFAGSLPAPADGSLYIVNKIFIEVCVLLTLLFIKEKGYGLYALKLFSRKKATGQTDNEARSLILGARY